MCRSISRANTEVVECNTIGKKLELLAIDKTHSLMNTSVTLFAARPLRRCSRIFRLVVALEVDFSGVCPTSARQISHECEFKMLKVTVSQFHSFSRTDGAISQHDLYSGWGVQYIKGKKETQRSACVTRCALLSSRTS